MSMLEPGCFSNINLLDMDGRNSHHSNVWVISKACLAEDWKVL